ncbi:MAG: UvrB/UvrC motif-containing protein, partial [Solobacterium sp.]|nr:UvrB/UvrC motif-containing protein [Solobacterium sp.]
RGKETKEMAAKYLKKKAKLSKHEKEKMLAGMEQEMREAARLLDFERAAELRDMIFELKAED